MSCRKYCRIFIFAEFGTQEVRFVGIFQFEFVVSAESSPTAPSPVFTLPSPWSPTLLLVYGHLFPSAVIAKWFPFVLGRMSRLAWKEKIFPGRRGRNQQIGEWLLVCSLQSLWLNFSSLMQVFSLQPESEKLCVSTKHCNKDEDYICYQVFYSKLLVKCSFAAEPENISPWDVFIDPHFSFRLHFSSAVFQLETHCHFPPVEAISQTGLWTDSQRNLPGPLYLCLKPQSAFIQCVCIYNMCICIYGLLRWEYHNNKKMFWGLLM